MAAALLAAGMAACSSIRSTGSRSSDGDLFVDQVRIAVVPPGDYTICFLLFAASTVVALAALVVTCCDRDVVAVRRVQHV